MRRRQTTSVQHLLREIEELRGRAVSTPAVQRVAERVLGPLVREVSVSGPDHSGVLTMRCTCPSARERAQSLESILLAELSSQTGVPVQRVRYRLVSSAGRAHVPERLTRQLKPVPDAKKKQIEEIARGVRSDALRERFVAWMTVVAQIDGAEE